MRAPIAATVLGWETTDALVATVLPNPTPVGWTQLQRSSDGASYNHSNGLVAIVTVANELDGKRWVHLSVSRAARLPSWDDLTSARDAFLGPEALAVQVLAPKSRHINIHAHCLHLWKCLDGDPVPDFARGGRSI